MPLLGTTTGKIAAMHEQKITIRDFCRRTGQLVELDQSQFLPLPPPYDKLELEPKLRPLSEEARKKYESDLDGVTAFRFPRPETEDEKRQLVEKFLSGLKKLFDRENNWTIALGARRVRRPARYSMSPAVNSTSIARHFGQMFCDVFTGPM
jgi:hypothetical protein